MFSHFGGAIAYSLRHWVYSSHQLPQQCAADPGHCQADNQSQMPKVGSVNDDQTNR